MKRHLPHELLWAEGGHASDIALTAIADAQFEAIPDEVHAHVDTCPLCTEQIGHLALLSLHTARLVTEVHAKEPARIPLMPVLAGGILATIGMLPTLLDRPLVAVGQFAADAQSAKAAGKGLFHALSHASSVSVSIGASMVILMIAVVVAQKTTRNEGRG